MCGMWIIFVCSNIYNLNANDGNNCRELHGFCVRTITILFEVHANILEILFVFVRIFLGGETSGI